MVDITLPNTAQQAGIPYQWEQNLNASGVALVTGNEPAVLTVDMIVAASQTIPALTPVGVDGSGRIIKAVSGTTAAIGIAVVDIVTDASTTYKGAAIYRGGCFNPDALAWDASYDTEVEKMNAFAGAPTPTNIIMRRPKTHQV